jgi:hypothetical protein
MNSNDLENRTKRFALDVIRARTGFHSAGLRKFYVGSSLDLPLRLERTIDRHAVPDPGLTSKIAVVEEEADESLYWMELLNGSGLADPAYIEPLMREADELTAIFTSAGKTEKRFRK